MKVTKHGHACLEIQQENSTLIIDPGQFSESMAQKTNVVGLVITHQHDDHCSVEQVRDLLQRNPGLKIFGPQEVAAKLAGVEVTTVYHGDHYEIPNFSLDFFGDLHQIIHRSIPVIQNTGVLVNQTLYYPGDSYTPPETRPQLLAMPSSAPWLRISDVIDYLELVQPHRAFPTHNGLLSDKGHQLQNSRIREYVEKYGGEFRYLEVGDSWEL